MINNFRKSIRKSSGQGQIEYFLVLVLVVIVVIAVLMTLRPLVETVLNPTVAQNSAQVDSSVDVNKSALSEAPFIREGINKPYLVPLYPEDYLLSWYKPGCHPMVPPPQGFGLKVGTISADSDGITITKDGDTYTLCNKVQGHQVAIISAFLERPQ